MLFNVPCFLIKGKINKKGKDNMISRNQISIIVGSIIFAMVLIVVVMVITMVNKHRLPKNIMHPKPAHPASYPATSLKNIPPSNSRESIEGDYLYVWTGSEDTTSPDFMAVIDTRPESPLFGQVISTARIPASDTFPHHMEMSLHNDNKLMANSFMANKNWRFDFRDPARPFVLGESESLSNKGFGFAHSFARLPNGDVVASLQQGPNGHGGLGVFDPKTGKLLKAVSSQDPTKPNIKVLTYGVETIPERNLIVTSSFNMDMKDPVPSLVQLYDINTLEFLESFVPEEALDECGTQPPTKREAQLTFEIRKFANNKKIGAVINTYNCGYYFLDLTEKPYKLHRACPIHNEKDGCAVPALAHGRFLVMPIENDHSLTVMDLQPDPLHPKKVDRFYFDPRFFGHYWPHWATFENKRSRVATSDFTDPEQSKPDGTVYMFHLHPKTGKLTLDTTFKSSDSKNPGVRFRKLTQWPHGETGPAIPHGLAFSHPRLDPGNDGCCCGMNCKCPPPCKCTPGNCCCNQSQTPTQN